MNLTCAQKEALNLDRCLVMGGEGSGKSYLANEIIPDECIAELAEYDQRLAYTLRHIGFWRSIDMFGTIDKIEFFDIASRGIDPYDIWRAIVVAWASGITGAYIPGAGWADRTAWVVSNAEKASRILCQANDIFKMYGKYGMIVFDGLEVFSSDDVIRGLLRVVSGLRSFSNLRGKVFLRSGQVHPYTTNFVDSSKLLAMSVTL